MGKLIPVSKRKHICGQRLIFQIEAINLADVANGFVGEIEDRAVFGKSS